MHLGLLPIKKKHKKVLTLSVNYSIMESRLGTEEKKNLNRLRKERKTMKYRKEQKTMKYRKERKTTEYKILFASRTALTKGIIDGECIDLTDKNALEKINAFKNAREGHEFFIGNSITSVPLDISEYDEPSELIALVSRLEDLNDTQLNAYEAMVVELGWACKEALDKAENWQFDAIAWDNEDCIEKRIGYYYAERNGCMDKGYIIRKYFDYESYGRDIIEQNYVCDNGKTIFVIY